MTKDEYSDYLKGRHWRRFRMKVIRDAGCCEICETTYAGENWSQRVEVHHWTYKNVPHEKRVDVSRLCKRCHTQAHMVMEGRFDELDTLERQYFEWCDDEVGSNCRITTSWLDRELFIQAVLDLHARANNDD